MLNFQKAIEIVEKPDAHKLVVDYLKIHAPDIAVLVEKDLTVGDVHVSSAGGNKKPRSFKERLAELSDGRPDKVIDEHEAAKRDFSIPLDIVKADADQQLIFGWASVSEIGGKLVVDKQDDVIMPDDLEKAAYDFVLDSRTQGDMHEKRGVGRLVESMMFTKQKQEALGIDLGMVGWFVGFKVDDPGLWAAHKRGERPEFSIGGKGERVEMPA